MNIPLGVSRVARPTLTVGALVAPGANSAVRYVDDASNRFA
ncbi:hypothetical protein [Trinickia symbiotica]|nr:hypothetical protein [Trinickia symbiotica]